MHGDVGAGGRAGAVGGRLDHRAHHFVAEDQRCAEDGFAGGAVEPVVQVGAADSAVGDVHHGFVGFGRCVLDGFDPEVADAVDDDGRARY